MRDAMLWIQDVSVGQKLTDGGSDSLRRVAAVNHLGFDKPFAVLIAEDQVPRMFRCGRSKALRRYPLAVFADEPLVTARLYKRPRSQSGDVVGVAFRLEVNKRASENLNLMNGGCLR